MCSTHHPGKDYTTQEIIAENIIRRSIGLENLAQPDLRNTTVLAERYHRGKRWRVLILGTKGLV